MILRDMPGAYKIEGYFPGGYGQISRPVAVKKITSPPLVTTTTEQKLVRVPDVDVAVRPLVKKPRRRSPSERQPSKSSTHREDILNLWLAGDSYGQIATWCGCTIGVVAGVVNRAGVRGDDRVKNRKKMRVRR